MMLLWLGKLSLIGHQLVQSLVAAISTKVEECKKAQTLQMKIKRRASLAECVAVGLAAGRWHKADLSRKRALDEDEKASRTQCVSDLLLLPKMGQKQVAKASLRTRQHCEWNWRRNLMAVKDEL